MESIRLKAKEFYIKTILWLITVFAGGTYINNSEMATSYTETAQSSGWLIVSSRFLTGWVPSYKNARERSKNDVCSNGSELETSVFELMFTLKYKWLHTKIFMGIYIYIHTELLYKHVSSFSWQNLEAYLTSKFWLLIPFSN